MVAKLEGDLLAAKAKVGIVVSRFNDFITSRLLDGAIDAFVRHGGNPESLTVAHVPGSLEIPVGGRFDAVVCLGCVIRGATDHYEHVVAGAARGIHHVSTQTGVPTIFGVITADNLEQAIERAGAKQGNAGAKAMMTAIEMVNLMRKLEG
jgi:6,7-dimethyl-8-ribityllumazine synthase